MGYLLYNTIVHTKFEKSQKNSKSKAEVDDARETRHLNSMTNN